MSATTAAARERIARRLATLDPGRLADYALLCHRDAAGVRLGTARHHQEWVRVLESREAHPWVVVIAPPGMAKDLQVDTPVLTTAGWKRHGDLAPGDRVFAPDGRPVRVLDSYLRGVQDCYRVEFSDGSQIVAGDRHDWDVLCDRERDRYDGRADGREVRTTKRVPETLETRDLLRDQRRPPAIPVASPLQMPARPLPVAPYLFGLWLGDGNSRDGRITVGAEDVAAVEAMELGPIVRYPSARAHTLSPSGLKAKLRAMGLLGAKRVPAEYRLAAVEDRLALLQGLMDSDGTIDLAGHAYYCSTAPALAADVRFLVCSLGMKASVVVGDACIDGRKTGVSYRVSFVPHLPVFRLPRKAARVKAATTARARRRYVTAVTRTVSQETNCIRVEGGKYLAGPQLVATHNTTWFSHVYPAWRLGVTGGRARIGIISNTATQAYTNSKVVAEVLESPQYQAIFPDVRADGKRGWRNNERFFTNTPQGNTAGLTAAGIGGPIQGKRFDEIILDDPTDWDDARSATVMEGQRTFVTGMLAKRFPAGEGPPFGKGGRMTVVMTRWSQHDLLDTFTDLGFVTVHMPALGYWDRVARCPDCGGWRDTQLDRLLQRCEHCGSAARPEVQFGEEPLWPEVESQRMLEDERLNDEIMFELVKQGNPKVLAGGMFEGEWFQRGEPPGEFEVVVQGVDTSSGKDQARGDYFALVTLGIAKDGQVWILDVDRARYTSPAQVEAVKRACAKWDPELIVIEDANEGNALYQLLVNETVEVYGRDGATRAAAPLPLAQYTPVKDKTFRAVPLSNAYRARKVWHPTGAKWVRSFEAELEAFIGPHDDQVDAAAMAYSKAAPTTSFRLRSLSA